MTDNLILSVDSYKLSHFEQYPEGTKFVSSYIEPRWNKDGKNQVLFFGLQAYLKEYLGKKITTDDIDEAEDFALAHGEPFNRAGWEYILNVHDGYLPLRIEALPEGTVHNLGVPQVQVSNTDPMVSWLVSYIETAILRSVWYPSTVATISWNAKQTIREFLEETCDDPTSALPFKLHDFGARGASSKETAGLGGMAHLVNFMGSDTISGVLYARKYYGEKMAAFSIPASEHSTITSWGEKNEVNAFRNMIEKFGGPGKIFACVSDSYDLWRAINQYWGQDLKDMVVSNGGTLVVRPDSGDPAFVVVNTLEKLGFAFGYSVNKKGYKVLPNYIRVIQGDGINSESIPVILRAVRDSGWSTENIAMGMGGGLLQNVNRDTFGYAMKVNGIVIGDSTWEPVGKNPKTDSNKKSKFGRQAVVDIDGTLTSMLLEDAISQKYENKLVVVWENGKLLKDWTFDEVRKRSVSING